VITGGETKSSDGVRYRVPKRDLMSGLQVRFGSGAFGCACRRTGARGKGGTSVTIW
jgi:hypothetical protein